MKRLIWLPIAGFLLIAGATVAAAAPSLIDSARSLITPSGHAAGGTITANDSTMDHPGQDLLTQVLSDLVSQNVITQAQSDAITQALQDKSDQLRAAMQARMDLIKSFIADGVITQDEINQLPADDPLRVAFDSIANDGQITLDQLRGLGPFGGHGFGPFGHMRGGPGMWPDPDNDSNPGASPSPSTSNS